MTVSKGTEKPESRGNIVWLVVISYIKKAVQTKNDDLTFVGAAYHG